LLIGVIFFWLPLFSEFHQLLWLFAVLFAFHVAFPSSSSFSFLTFYLICLQAEFFCPVDGDPFIIKGFFGIKPEFLKSLEI
jgi:hypothetical protein